MRNTSVRLFLLFLALSLKVKAQAPSYSDTLSLTQPIQRLIAIGDSLLKGSTDSMRIQAQDHFALLLDSILSTPAGPLLSFDQVKALSVARADNGQLKTLTWMLSTRQGQDYSYYGYLLLKEEKEKKSGFRVIRLHARNDYKREEIEFLRTGPDNWIGCIYYAAIHKRYKKKDHYLLLGWSPQSTLTTRKCIEPVQWNTQKVSLGLPVIKAGGKARSRLVFEYNARVTMSLRYHTGKDMVIMDHLASSDPRPEATGMYQLYGPDLSYDGLKFSKGQWLLVKDVDVRN
jgi:hypothetical protein